MHGIANVASKTEVNIFTEELHFLLRILLRTPYPIFIALSKMYHKIRFKVRFADQHAFGCDCGFLVFQNGQEIDRHISPNEFGSDEQLNYWEDIALNIY
ncbi:DUF1281 family ferredoxin-like fold protein [Vibrio parahaemolyticus]